MPYSREMVMYVIGMTYEHGIDQALSSLMDGLEAAVHLSGADPVEVRRLAQFRPVVAKVREVTMAEKATVVAGAVAILDKASRDTPPPA